MKKNKILILLVIGLSLGSCKLYPANQYDKGKIPGR